MLEEAKESSFGELSQSELRKELGIKLKAELGDEVYAYVEDIYKSFVITYEGDKYYRRGYSVSGTDVSLQESDIEVETAWVEKLKLARESDMNLTEETAVLTSVPRGEPTREAIDCNSPEVNTRETIAASFNGAEFKTGVIEGVIPIKPGISVNRKYYPADVIKRDVGIFNGMPVFYDHQDDGKTKLLKDNVGVLENARWDDKNNVPRADLRYASALESTVNEIKQKSELLGPERVGMSIDMTIKAKVKRVDGKIVQACEALMGGRLASCDIVYAPSAGGRVWESIREDEELKMLDNLTLDELRAARPDLVSAIESETEEQSAKAEEAVVQVEAKEVISEDSILTKVKEAIATERKRSEFELRVKETKVPDKIKQKMLKEAEDTGFEASACESIITEWCNLIAAKDGTTVNVPGGNAKVSESFDVAKARLLGAAMGEDQEVNGERVPRFTGLREAILAFHPEMLNQVVYNPNQFARESLNLMHWGGGMLEDYIRAKEAISTTTFTNAWADVLRKSLMKEIGDPDLNTWRRWISDIVRFDDLTNTKKFIKVGDYPEIATVAEGAPYQNIVTPGEEKVEFAISKYGNLEVYTWEAALRDDLRVLARIPRALGRAWAWTVYNFVYKLLDQAAGVGATVDYDAKALYHADHSNIATSAFTAADLITVEDKIRQQTALSSGFKKTYKPRFLLYESNAGLRQNVWEALNAMFKVNPLSTSGSQVNLPNFIREVLGLEAIEVDYPTASAGTRWEVIADPRDAPTAAVGFLNGQETPDLFVQDMERVGSVFTADKITFKIRGTVGADVLDHRSFSRGNV